MRYFFITIIGLFIITLGSTSVYAQKTSLKANLMHELDTIIFIPNICHSDADVRGLTYCIKKNILYLCYYNKYIHLDTIRIYSVDLVSKKLDSIDFIIKGISKKLSSFRISSFDVNENQIILLISDELLIIEKANQPNSYKFEIITFDNEEWFQGVKFIKTNEVFLYRSYNYYNPNLKNFEKTKILVYNFYEHKTIFSLSPHVSNIELSSMGPYEIINTIGDKILVGQNINYNFTIYNSELKPINNFSRKFESWNNIDSSILGKLNSLSKSNTSTLMNYLRPKFLQGFSLCDGYLIKDSNTIIIRYTLGRNTGDTICRTYDILRFDEHLNNFSVADTNYVVENNLLLLKNAHLDEKISESNFYTDFWLNKSIFYENNTIVFMKRSPIYPVGLTFREYTIKDNNYIIQNDAIFSLTILKNKF